MVGSVHSRYKQQLLKKKKNEENREEQEGSTQIVLTRPSSPLCVCMKMLVVDQKN